MITLRKPPAQKRNPYIGPYPFTTEDQLYGREREARALRDLLIAERIVLLHSPSGAGKTSLIQAALAKTLARKGFEVAGPLRVSAPPPNDDVNRYLWSALLGLGGVSAEDADGSLAAALDRLDERHDGPPRRRVLIFDQFEEVLTLDPTDRAGQEGFFKDVGEALEKDHRWALFSMREDYMGGLARFAIWIPSHLRVRYRLDFLERPAALRAVQLPTQERHVDFTDEAAQLVVDDLATTRVQHPDKDEPDTVAGLYVEPVQLQVVCNRLWRKVQGHSGKIASIEKRHVEKYGDFEGALASFYADAVGSVAKTTKASERAIRDWCEDALITKQGFRRQSSSGPQLGDVDVRAVLQELESGYVIRSDERRGTRWYELAHDNLVGPVRRDNAAWRKRHLDRWEAAADHWKRSERRHEYLLSGPDVQAARRWLKHQDDGSYELVREYVDASSDAQGKTLAARLGTIAAMLFWVVLVQFALIVYLLVR